MMGHRGYDISYFAALKEYNAATFESKFPEHFNAYPTQVQTQLVTKLDHKTFRSLLSWVFTHRANPAQRCLVYFAEIGNTKLVPITEAQTFGMVLEEQKCTNGIIITHAKMSPQAMARISELEAPGIYFLQHYLDDDLMYDPLDSEWGSKYRILNEDEKKDLFSKIHPSKMPGMMASEPIAKYLGIQAGQVVECMREAILPETLVKRCPFYRYVRAGPTDRSKSSKAPAKAMAKVQV